MSAQVAALRRTLEERFPAAVPVAFRTAQALGTGWAELDGALPGGGLPRGRLSVWAGTGATAVLRGACAAALARGERAAWVDAARTTSGEAEWGGIALVRPARPADALLCAEELLRSGGFAVVVLAGAETAGGERVRLVHAARDGGAALVEAGSADGWMAAVRMASWVPPGGVRWRRDALGEAVGVESVGVRVRATALGWRREAEVELPLLARDVRLSLEPGVGDRRGAAR
jgi:hypothetical protein